MSETRTSLEILAITRYGDEPQRDMMIEEMSELTQAICKYRRDTSETTKANILEEIADVQIMLDQMKIMFGNTRKIENEKLHRLAKRLGVEYVEEIPTKLTPEQKKAVKWLVDGGYDAVRLVCGMVRAESKHMGVIIYNDFGCLHFVHSSLKDADWLTDKPIELRGLLEC